MRCLWIMFVTAVCFLFLLKLKWPKNKNIQTGMVNDFEDFFKGKKLVKRKLRLHSLYFPQNMPVLTEPRVARPGIQWFAFYFKTSCASLSFPVLPVPILWNMLWCMIFPARKRDAIEARPERISFSFRNTNESGCFDPGRNPSNIESRVLNGWVALPVFSFI